MRITAVAKSVIPLRQQEEPCAGRAVFISLVLLCAFGLDAADAGAWERNVHLGVESFTWREFSEGTRAVKESGPRFGAGVTWRHRYGNQATAQYAAEVFGGMVDYDGEACDLFGNCVPAASDVDYVGLRLKGEFGRNAALKSHASLEPFGGLGLDIWRRDVNGGSAEDGTPTAGYIEDWISLHARVGLRARIVVTESSAVFAEGGIKLPLYNSNTAYLSDIGYGNDITVDPGRENSFFAEAGLTVNRITLSAFYDSMRFSESGTEFTVSPAGGIAGFRQPRSESDVYGIRIGWKF